MSKEMLAVEMVLSVRLLLPPESTVVDIDAEVKSRLKSAGFDFCGYPSGQSNAYSVTMEEPTTEPKETTP